jgi:hypothetical protein
MKRPPGRRKQRLDPGSLTTGTLAGPVAGTTTRNALNWFPE